MRSTLVSFATVMLTTGFASCAQPGKATAATRSSPVGTNFDASGRVSLHLGQPCTSQIMFDFRGARSTSIVWLAAPKRESTILTDAARHRRHVHVTGVWQRGRARGCGYVNVARVELRK